MILKNLLLYIQVFTLTASLTRENTGATSNQREESELKSVHEQYGPADSKIVKGIGSIDARSQPDILSYSWKKQNSIPKNTLYPKTPTGVLEDGPAWIRNVAKHFKEKFLLEKYRRPDKAIYPLKPSFLERVDLYDHKDSIVEELENPGLEVIQSDEKSNKTLENEQKSANGVPEFGRDLREGEEIHANAKSRKRAPCFADDETRKMSILVPCHFVSRLFYYLLLLNQVNVRIFLATSEGSTKVMFTCNLREILSMPRSRPANVTSNETSEELPRSAEDQVPTLVGRGDLERPPDIEGPAMPSPPSKPEDDISAPKKDSEMPSFDEWKMQQEEEKNKDQKELQNSFPNHAKPKIAKKEINYASVTCGAKVIQANPEAQNPSFMLYENKDQYMINPCSVKKGFTVELCEAIQVQTVELGNMEFFSSLPQTFDVHVSERFPVKEWIHVGTFQAKNERTIQSFPVQSSLTYAKYVRIDILSHYGNEHFCPLSVLRVFGVSLDDDDEVETSHDETDYSDIIDVTVPLDSRDGKPNNLFSKATDTVISIMKTVLPSAKTHSQGGNSTDAQPLANQEASNITAPGDQPKVTVKRHDMDRCLLDHDSLPFREPSEMCSLPVDLTCSYYRLLVGHSLKVMCPNLEQGSLVAEVSNASLREDVNGKVLTPKKDKVTDANESGFRDVTSIEASTSDKILTKDGSEVIDMEAKAKIVDRPPFTVGKQTLDEEATEMLTEKSDKLLECSDLTSKDEGGTVDAGEFLDEHSRSDDLDGQKRLVSNQSGVTRGGALPSQSGVGEGEGSANHKKEVSNDGPRLEPLKDYEFDTSNLDDVTYQKLSSKGKESVFAKLKNRIKTLEISLNLTNRYLEELSQRYKKQTEEMYTSLNKTISKLINTAKSAEERDLRQQDRIQSLEMRFSNLTSVVSSLHRSFQDVHSQVLERHLILMAVEFALFFALLTYCQGSRRHLGPHEQHSRRSSAPAVTGKTSTSGVVRVDGTGGDGISASEAETFPDPRGDEELGSYKGEELSNLTPINGENNTYDDMRHDDTDVISDGGVASPLGGELQVEKDSRSSEQIEFTGETSGTGCFQEESQNVKDVNVTEATAELVNNTLVFIGKDCPSKSQQIISCCIPIEAANLKQRRNEVNVNLQFVGDVSGHLLFPGGCCDSLPAESLKHCKHNCTSESGSRLLTSRICVDILGAANESCLPFLPASEVQVSLSKLDVKQKNKLRRRRNVSYLYVKNRPDWNHLYAAYLGSRPVVSRAWRYLPQNSGTMVRVEFRA